MCGRRRNACHSHRYNAYNSGCYQPRRQGFLRTIITQAMESREEKKRLMAQSQGQVIWEPKTNAREREVGRQTSGVAAWVDEKQNLRLEEPRTQRQSRRIEVEGPPSYGEVMKTT